MKNFVLAFLLVVAVAAVFGLGYHLRSAEMLQPVRQASIAFNTQSAWSAYMVTARPSVGTDFLPPADASQPDQPAPTDASGGSESDADRQIDDLLNSDSPAATFQQVYLLLKDQFVDNIDSDEPLAHGAASALLSSLDEPNSRFVDAGERAALEQQATGLYSGTGAAFTVRKVVRQGGLIDRQVTVIDALPGTPAGKAGLRTGDVITAVDGHWVIAYDPFEAQADQFKKLVNDPYDLSAAVDATEKKYNDGFTLDKAQSLLDTTLTSPLRLTVQRPGQSKPFDVTLDVSAPTQVSDIEYRELADGNGYIAFNAFTNSTASDFAQAVNSFGNVKGIVIDLRDCPGGELDPATEICKALAPGQPIGEIDVRSEQSDDSSGSAPVPTRTRQLDSGSGAQSPSLSFHGPISVLVNKGTANTAELLAAFLHDHVGARIVGTSTFCDGLAQAIFPLSDGSAFTLTTGVLKTDDGIAFNQTGLAPQYALVDPGHAGDGDSDAAMTKAIELLALGPVAPDIAGQHPIQAASLNQAPTDHALVARKFDAVFLSKRKDTLMGPVEMQHGGPRQ